MMSVTLKHVADLSGVSPMTVSRVIRGLSRVAPATRKKVQDAVSALGLQQSEAMLGAAVGNAIAENRLKLMVVMADEENVGFAAIFGGLKQRLMAEGGIVTVVKSSEVLDMERSGKWPRPHGCVFLGKIEPEVVHILKRRWPCVLAGASNLSDTIDSVSMNENRAAAAILDHLSELGHRQIFWLGVDHEQAGKSISTLKDLIQVLDRPGNARYAAWQFLAEYQLGNEPSCIRWVAAPKEEKQWAQTINGCWAWFSKMNPRPTSLIVEDEELAARLLKHFSSKEVRVPRDLSVISYGNSKFSQTSSPPLTSVSPPWKQIGQTLPELVRRRMIHPSAPVVAIELEAKLVQRKSTTPL